MVAALFGARQVRAQEPPAKPACAAQLNAPTLTTDEIVARMMEANRVRSEALIGYTATRWYEAENLRWKKSATMQATVRFTSPSTKLFTVVSETGTGIIRRMVFRGMMDAEQDALTPEMRRRTDINTSNYHFHLVGEEELDGHRAYVLEAEPLRADKYLFRGRIWVEACEFAIMRVQGSPAKQPSFWTRKVEYERHYRKVGDFWLPAREEATSDVRIFGRSHVKVEYSDYQVESAKSQ